jgi:hypothetical protein
MLTEILMTTDELFQTSDNNSNDVDVSNDVDNVVDVINEYFYRCYLYFKKDSDTVKIHEIANNKHSLFEIAWYCHTRNRNTDTTDSFNNFIELLNYAKLHDKDSLSCSELSQLLQYDYVKEYIEETQYDSIIQYRPGASIHVQNPSVISVLFMLNA